MDAVFFVVGDEIPPIEGGEISDEKLAQVEPDAQPLLGHDDGEEGLGGGDAGGGGVSATQLLSQPGALPSPVVTPAPLSPLDMGGDKTPRSRRRRRLVVNLVSKEEEEEEEEERGMPRCMI